MSLNRVVEPPQVKVFILRRYYYYLLRTVQNSLHSLSINS